MRPKTLAVHRPLGAVSIGHTVLSSGWAQLPRAANKSLTLCRNALGVHIEMFAHPHSHSQSCTHVQYELPVAAHMTATQCCAKLARLRQVDHTHATAVGRSGRAHGLCNLDDPQLKRRCLDDLPFPTIAQNNVGDPVFDYGLILSSSLLLTFFFCSGEGVYLDRQNLIMICFLSGK